VEALAQTAQDVVTRNDYSLRARKFSADELGSLTETFNRMLEHIQRQDAERVSREKFETLVNSIHGIVWEADPETLEMLFVSSQAERLLGYPTHLWLENVEFREHIIHPEDRAATLEASKRGLDDGQPFQLEYRCMAADGRVLWMRESISVWMEAGKPARMRGVAIDITEQKLAGERLTHMQEELVAASRLAGMAEVATGVLHNVGNVLNSVNVSVALIVEHLRKSKIPSLAKVVGLLRQHRDNLGEFVENDPKGKQIPAFLEALAEQLTLQQASLVEEAHSLQQNVDHVKQVVALQQSYAKVSGALEHLSVQQLVEDALRMASTSLARHHVEIVREFGPVPPVVADRHKVLQILVNLLGNAKEALEQRPNDRRIVLRIDGTNRGVRVEVADNGPGIASENLARIFSHGFTTKPHGHGFGLHIGANAAKEMGGSLQVHSDGLGHGATFFLELPSEAAGVQLAPATADEEEGRALERAA
jgi:PAS domain S-box-containing protein